MQNSPNPTTPEAEAEVTLPGEAPSGPAPTPVAVAAPAAALSPTLTYKISEAHLQVEVSATHREGDDYYKVGGALELPLDAAGRYDVAQLEGALASFTVIAARLEGMVSQAWMVKQQTLRAERARAALTARLKTAMQSICVPAADMQAALLEFFGGVPVTPADCELTLAKIAAMRAAAKRPEGWRWQMPVRPGKKVVPEMAKRDGAVHRREHTTPTPGSTREILAQGQSRGSA
jgi:hypothetical protein